MNIQTLTEKILVNWPVKIICLVLALLLFLFYRFSTLTERTISVPINIETNGDLVPSSDYPRTVKIKMRGETDSLYTIQESDIYVYFDVSNYSGEGEVRVPATTRLSGKALDVNPLEITVEPFELAIRLEHQIIKHVPVKPVYKGFPLSGMEFAGGEIVPTIVEIRGPRSVISRTNDISTEPIDLSAKSESFTGTTKLINPAYPMMMLKPSQTEYRVTLTQAIVTKKFENVTLFFENLDSQFSIESTQFSGVIQLQGERAVLDSWNQTENLLTVFCETIDSEGEYILLVQPIVPPVFQILEFSPQQIMCTVTKRTP